MPLGRSSVTNTTDSGDTPHIRDIDSGDTPHIGDIDSGDTPHIGDNDSGDASLTSFSDY